MQHYQKDSAHVDFPSVSSCTWVALVDVQEAYCSSNGSFKSSNDVYYCPLDYPDDRRKERECKVGTVRYWYEGHFRRQTGMRCNLQSRKRTQQAPFHLDICGQWLHSISPFVPWFVVVTLGNVSWLSFTWTVPSGPGGTLALDIWSTITISARS